MFYSAKPKKHKCSTWNIAAWNWPFVRTDRADAPFAVTRHAVRAAGQGDGALRLRIVHLTDMHLHAGYPPQKLRRLVGLVNAQRPDLIVFTGDLLRRAELRPLPRGEAGGGPRKGIGGRDPGEAGEGGAPRALRGCSSGRPAPAPHTGREEEDALAILRGLSARYGKYAVRGNHDLRGNLRQAPFYLKRAGFRLLCNEQAEIALGGGRRLVIAGLDDGAHGLTCPRAALALRGQSGFRLVLAHEPMLARLLPPGAAELVLAGHTHAGQFRLGPLKCLWMPRLSGGMWQGWYEVNANPVYVSAGLGESGVGLRILCPAELPVFDCWISAPDT